MSELFKQRMRDADPRTFVNSALLVDTNVIAEFDTLSDVLRLTDELGSEEACLRSSKYDYRVFRAQHSTVLAWWLAKNRIYAGGLGNEAIDLVTTRIAHPRERYAYAMAKAISLIVRPLVWKGWHLAAITTVNHDLTGEKADDELLRVAIEDKIPLITWEGFTENGFVSNPRKLRDKCRANGVEVHTPAEFLHAKNVNIADESQRLLFALRKAVREAKAKRILDGKDVVDYLVPVFRLVLLDEIDPAFAHVERVRFPARPRNRESVGP